MDSGIAPHEYLPPFPDGPRPCVGIVGCGRVVRSSHLPAYARYGVRVAGVHARDPVAAAAACAPLGVRVFERLDELLDVPEVEIVDVATPVGVRPELIRRVLAAGKHVLAQKPLAPDLATARELVADAERRGLQLAVNQNGRWAPPWRVATLLVERGTIGEPFAVTHLYEKAFDFALGTDADVERFVLADYSLHVFDVTRCWLAAKRPTRVRARDWRTPAQPREAVARWGAWAAIEYEDGTSATIRSTGGAAGARPALHFWVHGTEGTLRGSVGGAGPGTRTAEALELHRGGAITRYELDGGWHPEGFAGTLAELAGAIGEGREAANSARHTLLSLELTLAAVASAEQDGAPVAVGGAAEVGCD